MAEDNQVDVKITASSDQLEEGVNQAADAVDASTEQMSSFFERLSDSVSESMEAAGERVREFAEKTAESAAETKESLEGIATAISSVQKAMALIAEVAMLGFVGEKVADLGKEFAEYGEQTEIASRKTGMSTNAVQELGFAANMTGVSAEGMNQAMMRLARAQTEAEGGSKQLQAVFESLGISTKQLEDTPLDQVLAKIADKFADTEDGSTKAAISMQLFGRAGADLIPLLDKGSDGIDEFRAKAKELGVVMGEDDIEAGEKLNEQLKEMDAQMSALKLRAGSELAPAMLSIVEAMSQVDEKGGALDTMFVGLADVMKGLAAGGFTVVAAFNTLAEAIVTAAVAAKEAATGNFSTAAAAIKIGIDNIYKSASDAQEAIDKLFASAKDVGNLDFGEGANSWGEMGKLKAPDATGGSGPSQVEVWKEQLQEQEEAQGDYFKNNLRDEEQFWEQKLALVAKGSKDYIAVEHELYQIRSELAHQSLAEDLSEMREEAATAENGSLQKIEIASREADRIGQAYGYQSSQYKAALAEMLKAGKEYADAQVQIVVDGMNRQEQAELAAIARSEDAEKSKYKQHQESSAQETAALIADENQRYAIEMDTLQREMALYSEDSKNYQKLLDEKAKATEAHNTEIQKINEQGAQQTQQAWDSAFKQIDNSINSSVMGMIRGTETLQQAVVKVADQMLSTMINSILQMAERWAAGEAQKIASSQTASTILNALGIQDAATSRTTQTATSMSEIASQAAVAAAAAYASTAAIPVVGPAMAPAAATEAYSSVLAFEGMASAAGGYYQVPNDQIAQIHANEMVLPSWAAEGMRNVIMNQSSGGGGGTASGSSGQMGNMAMSFNVTCPDPQGFVAMINQQAPAIMSAVQKQMRNFQR